MTFSRSIILLSIIFLFIDTSCKKNTATSPTDTTTLQQYFEQTILNKEFVVEYAKDAANDRTSEFDGFKFILTKTTSYLNGPMTGTKDSVTYTGTWASNDDYGQLIININNPTPPSQFSYLNRTWKFTKKALPIMELAPWGPDTTKILHMRRL